MTNQATIEKLKQMKLNGMLQAFQTSMQTNITHNFTPDEMIAHLVDAEWDERYNRKLTRLIKAANFRHNVSFEQIDFIHSRNLDKNLMLRLSGCGWIESAENILITGPTGVGKSFLACALGHQATRNEYAVSYSSCVKLFSRLKFAKADGTYEKELKKSHKENLAKNYANTRIAYSAKGVIWIMSPDGSNKKQVFKARSTSSPRWSPYNVPFCQDCFL